MTLSFSVPCSQQQGELLWLWLKLRPPPTRVKYSAEPQISRCPLAASLMVLMDIDPCVWQIPRISWCWSCQKYLFLLWIMSCLLLFLFLFLGRSAGGGDRRVYVCLASLVVHIQKRSGLFVSFELRVSWDCVLNNLCLFLHQLLEFFIYWNSRRLRHGCEWLCSALLHASVHILEKMQFEGFWFTNWSHSFHWRSSEFSNKLVSEGLEPIVKKWFRRRLMQYFQRIQAWKSITISVKCNGKGEGHR